VGCELGYTVFNVGVVALKGIDSGAKETKVTVGHVRSMYEKDVATLGPGRLRD